MCNRVDIERSHTKLWGQNTAVLKAVVTEAVVAALPKRVPVPPVLASLLPRDAETGTTAAEKDARDVIFFIKSSPYDDEFTLWLAPKLEAEGYQVFADILTLQPGDRWRREMNRALQHRATKVLLLCRNATLNDQDVQDDIDIARDVATEINDQRFIIPLRLENGPKVKGIGDAVAVDFVRGWGAGLTSLLEALRRQKVAKRTDRIQIDPNWDLFRRRGAVPIVNEPERLTSNWLRVMEAPDLINYYEATGVVESERLKRSVAAYHFPIAIHGSGFLTFANQSKIDADFQSVGRFQLKHRIPLQDFVDKGFPKLGIRSQTASNQLNEMLKRAWFLFCKERGFVEYQYSNGVGFHASPELAPTGKRIPWGKQGSRRSSMLRNMAKGHIWQFGVTALPTFRPFWHFKLKSRVLFSADNGTPEGLAIDDPQKMHRLRRTGCKGWRNKQWYSRMLAFLELMSGESAYIRLRLSTESYLLLEAAPVLFSSPVSTALPDLLDSDDEEADLSTLGRPEIEEEREV